MIFRSYDIRGVWDKDLNEEIAEKIGKAFGTFIKGKEVCVGWDTRKSSPILAKKLIEGLISTGCKVFCGGMIPNPSLYFFCLKNKIFGCYVTASHNPKNWNGVKFIKRDGTSFTKELKKIEKIFNSSSFKKGGGKVIDKNIFSEYEKFISKNFGNLNGKIVAEFFGCIGYQGKEIFEKTGLKVIGLHSKPDPNFFGFKRPEPKGGNLKLLKKRTKKENVLFGVAFDGDADRSVFIDENGREINGSLMSLIFSKYLLKNRKGKIVLTYDCASELENYIKSFGGKIIWERVGHGFIEKRCKKERALFGGEQSSHFYFNIFYPFSDGILSTLYLAKILNETNQKLSQLVKKFKINPIKKIYINARKDVVKDLVIKSLKKKFKGSDLMDGFKLNLNKNEWILIRASQTLPEINLCIQAKNKRRMKYLIGKFTKIIKKEISLTIKNYK